MSYYIVIRFQSRFGGVSLGPFTSAAISDEETKIIKRHFIENHDLDWGFGSYNSNLKYHVEIITEKNEVATLRKKYGDLFVIGTDLKKVLMDRIEKFNHQENNGEK